jgi:uncharacterized protein YbjT (DUF2867 family)
MKIVVVGRRAVIGSKLFTKLRESGHDLVAASPGSTTATVTGESLPEVLSGAQVVVEGSIGPNWDYDAVMRFFRTAFRSLLTAEADAGIRHHVALSVVRTERLVESSYFRAKNRTRDADQGLVDPLLDRRSDAALRVHEQHRRRGH